VANTLEIIIKATDKASKEIAGVSRGISGLGSAAAAVGKGIAIGIGAGVAAISAATVALGKFTIDAMALQGVEKAFEGVTGAAEETIAALRAGSLGMIADDDLMKSYNKAAQLVSKTFADQLPDAMKYLTKVSAATGQSMDYMMDSLVIGVGRLSPRILDNLAIQVSLEEATANAAEQFGVEADALTNAQIQVGMMNVVMEKLRVNTAKMPDIAGTAQQRWMALGATWKNVKDQLGTGFIPVLERLMGWAEGMVKNQLPQLVDWFQNKLAPGVGEAIDRIATFIEDIKNGDSLAGSIRVLLAGVFSEDALTRAINVVKWVQAMYRALEAGDWKSVGTMIWEQIQIGWGKFTAFDASLSAQLAKAVGESMGLVAEAYTDTSGNWVETEITWQQIGTELVNQLALGAIKGLTQLNVWTDALLAWATSGAGKTAMTDLGRSLGGSLGAEVGAGANTAANQKTLGDQILSLLGNALKTTWAAAKQMFISWLGGVFANQAGVPADIQGILDQIDANQKPQMDLINKAMNEQRMRGTRPRYENESGLPSDALQGMTSASSQSFRELGASLFGASDGITTAATTLSTAAAKWVQDLDLSRASARAFGQTLSTQQVETMGALARLRVGMDTFTRWMGTKTLQPNSEANYGLARANGGWASGLTKVGERGPEIVNLPSGSYVHDNRESERMMAGGGTTVNIMPGAIIVHAPDAKAAGIGVLRELRAAGVGV
jgi:hypothetical protein